MRKIRKHPEKKKIFQHPFEIQNIFSGKKKILLLLLLLKCVERQTNNKDSMFEQMRKIWRKSPMNILTINECELKIYY